MEDLLVLFWCWGMWSYCFNFGAHLIRYHVIKISDDLFLSLINSSQVCDKQSISPLVTNLVQIPWFDFTQSSKLTL